MFRPLVSGTFNGTGADLYVCIGFVPDFVKLFTTETTDEEAVFWSINRRGTETIQGISVDDDGTVSPDTYATGVAVYRGGDLVTSASTTYIHRDPEPDKRASGTGATIDTWTLDTSANRSGHWNDVCNTTYVGEGSRICIDGVWYTIISVTSNGEAADEVVLNEAVSSGTIEALTGMYDYLGMSSGRTKPGFWLDSTCTVNSSGELCYFEAGCYC